VESRISLGNAIVSDPRIVAEFRVLDQMPEYIDAKAIEILPKLETHDVVDRLTTAELRQFQIGLLSQEDSLQKICACFHGTIIGNEPCLTQRLEPEKENVDDYSTR
jgi:hypothetical protein